MTRKTILALGAVTLIAGSVAVAKGKGILYPDWSKPQGTYQAPVAELGQKPSADSPWTVTTITSAIDKPLKGKPVTAVGEVVDISCYLQVGKHGEKHRDCGQKCVRNGQPAGLLLSDGTLYMLIDEEHDPRRDGLTTLRQQLVDHMAHVVKVNGTYSEVEGQKALYVQGTVKN
ncbi:MAG: hypothetical protein ACK47B_05505 [Armatimonadota bacterium]